MGSDKAEELAREIATVMLDEVDRNGEWLQSKDYAVKRIAALLRSHLGERWIPVSERLPENGETCIVTVAGPDDAGDDYRGVITGYLGMNNKWSGLRGWCDSKVTHWRPLPAPPKEGETR